MPTPKPCPQLEPDLCFGRSEVRDFQGGQHFRDGLTSGWVTEVGSEVLEGTEDKVPLGQTGVRKREFGGVDNGVAVQEEIEVDEARAVFPDDFLAQFKL